MRNYFHTEHKTLPAISLLLALALSSCQASVPVAPMAVSAEEESRKDQYGNLKIDLDEEKLKSLGFTATEGRSRFEIENEITHYKWVCSQTDFARFEKIYGIRKSDYHGPVTINLPGPPPSSDPWNFYGWIIIKRHSISVRKYYEGGYIKRNRKYKGKGGELQPDYVEVTIKNMPKGVNLSLGTGGRSVLRSTSMILSGFHSPEPGVFTIDSVKFGDLRSSYIWRKDITKFKRLSEFEPKAYQCIMHTSKGTPGAKTIIYSDQELKYIKNDSIVAVRFENCAPKDILIEDRPAVAAKVLNMGFQYSGKGIYRKEHVQVGDLTTLLGFDIDACAQHRGRFFLEKMVTLRMTIN